jgi:hypothetical protein
MPPISEFAEPIEAVQREMRKCIKVLPVNKPIQSASGDLILYKRKMSERNMKLQHFCLNLSHAQMCFPSTLQQDA